MKKKLKMTEQISHDPQFAIHSDVKQSRGDSVDEYENLKDANEMIASNEIGQQNENL
ncbi:hypothetical protein [Bacillus sp. REN10]|uniref:hypothetical protein n=1 Tax=Bacillus sp. REN10 TaxID=2782541 RepID=UPI00193AEE22|nr:hypothetical protein [Bacillus sp. REN10]